MMARTHLAFGALAAALLAPIFSYGNSWRFVVLVLLGSLLPDIDHPQSKYGRKIKPISYPITWMFGHRGFWHSVYVPAVMLGAGYAYTAYWPHLLAVSVGYMAHLFSDMLTVQGIKFFYPVAKLRVSGFIHTGTQMEEVLRYVVLFVLVLFLVWRF
ncbi:MAG: metal-dependent hydrolase [Candidatus Nanoarchaeia archaeon]